MIHPIMQNTLNKKNKMPTYKKWEYTDKDYYWVTVLCNNCNESSQLGILKGIPINKSRLNFIKCFRCEVKGKLVIAVWNGSRYVER